MAEKINDKTVFSLLEVTKSIQNTLNDRYKSSFWVKAEMNKLNFYKHSGHCYPELVEKKDGKVIALLKSYLWKDDYFRINAKFIETLHEPLKDGIKILFLAKITFDPSHGLSLWIMDIDPSYTLGDLEREKQETIYQLRSEGIFEKNKTLSLPLLPQRIAIISVETSKGYADFIKVIGTNSWGYKFFWCLFPSLLQGDNAVQSIIDQLERIRKVRHHFDVVAIIRGGGGDVGLSCFNTYLLSKTIALFPIPVITGIGHATNETVTEMISFANAITPTKLAEFLLQKFHNFSIPVQSAEKKIFEKTTRLLGEEKMKFAAETKLFRSVTDNIFNMKKMTVSQLKEKLQLQSLLMTKNALTEMTGIEKNVANMSPANVLKRGYSITLFNGKSVTGISQVKEGDILNTIVHEGNIVSIVNSTNKNNA
ncbi:MAG: exodeoxyribonuclease VII large subunit [Prevotellaceae bacterium]|jgi:exodeoxyribonuclease VII large subunit|nr:exodeoxyribonuclease VII large subunit [Prevotellaceae bacterium]